MEFVDRRDAGRMLAARLLPLGAGAPGRDGACRAAACRSRFEVARALGAPLDVLAVRKLGAPGNPEFGVGAIAEDGTAVLDHGRPRGASGMTQELLDATVEREVRELRRRVERYRDGRAPIDVRGRTVIVVDDGLATGLTDLAAVRALRARGAARIVVAVPVGARESVALRRRGGRRGRLPHDPARAARGRALVPDFSPVSDEEVLALLGAALAIGRDARTDATADAEPRPPSRRARAAAGHRRRRARGRPDAPRAAARARDLRARQRVSSRLSPRNRAVAATLNEAGLRDAAVRSADRGRGGPARARVRHPAAGAAGSSS